MLLNDFRNHRMPSFVRMNPVLTEQGRIIHPVQQPVPYIDQAATFPFGNLPDSIGIALLPAGNAFRILPEIMKDVFSVPFPADPVIKTAGHERKRRDQHRLQKPLPGFPDKPGHVFPEFFQRNMPVMKDPRLFRNSIPVQVAVISAELDHAPGSGFNLQGAGAAHSLGDFFTMETDISISGESRGQTYTMSAATRAQLISSYFMMRPLLTSLSVSLSEIEVEFTDDSHTAATVKCSAMATGTTQNADFFREARQISAEMVREDDGEWRFRSLRADPVIEFD